MAQCNLCKRIAPDIAGSLGVCAACIRQRPPEALVYTEKAHMQSRAVFGLQQTPPNASQGFSCNLFLNQCSIAAGETGYCGLRRNQGAQLTGVSSDRGKLSWYHDSLPTNCVAEWVCAGGTGAGYPRFANRSGAEIGYKNLAVFFGGCSFDCLFCQNWHFRDQALQAPTHTVADLLANVDQRTSRICYFGGDPSPQLPFSIKASRKAIDQNKDRILRICWETNGSMHPELLDEVMELAIISGGCVKFDLKAWEPSLHRALTGVTNRRTLTNFRRAAAMIERRTEPPVLIASSLLIPGYVDEAEIRAIAQFIADLNPSIPYSLLAFYPQYLMADLPLTGAKQAERCCQAARDAGLKRVRIGNAHLLEKKIDGDPK